MDFKKKNREEISRLVSDRQAYISSLELKLEKFTQNTSSYLDIKEKLEKLYCNLSSAEEKIQGLTWLLKSQNENHQQQIKALTSRYEDLQTNFSSLSYTSVQNRQMTPTQAPAPNANTQIPNQVIRDLQEYINLNSMQVRNEVDQRLEILNSKQLVFCKGIENKLDSLQYLEARVKEELEVSLKKISERSAELQKDFSSRLESTVSLNSERYKELMHKVNMSGSSVVTEELNTMRQKLARIEESHKAWQENEMKRDLEVREASQAAWTVETQLKQLEKSFSSKVPAASEHPDHYFQNAFDAKVNHLAGSLKKYVSLQKVLHAKVESLEDVIRSLQTVKIKKASESDRNLSVPKAHSSSSRPSPTPGNKTTTAKNGTRSRIDILYDELTKIVN